MLKKCFTFLSVSSTIGRRRYANFANNYTYRTHTCGDLRLTDVGKTVRLCGWLYHQRLCKFLVLRDAYGTIQVYNSSKCEKLKALIESLAYESVLQIDGKVSARPPKDRNPNMTTGDVEIQLENLTVINPSNNLLPINITAENYQTPNELLRFQYRYLDLRRHTMQNMLRFRARLIHKMRNFLESRKFVEVETPTLFRRTPGGAAEFIVPSSDQPGQFYCLPQSPQQFKQLLMVGGLDRYYQIARCYRDEGAKPDRQPEFTQLDIELSFTNQTEVMKLIEDVILASWPERNEENGGCLFERPLFNVMTYETAMTEYGSDKPDIRYEMKLHNDNETVSIIIPDSKHLIDKEVVSNWRNVFNTEYITQNLKFYCFQKQSPSGHWLAIDTDDDCLIDKRNDIIDYCNTVIGCRSTNDNDTILISTTDVDRSKARKTMGILRQWAADVLETRGGRKLRNPNEYRFLWIIDFPLFLPKEDGQGGFESAHHPFTAPAHDHATLLYSDPAKVTGQHYDLVLNGMELGGGSIRIHDASMQRYVLEKILNEDASTMNHLMEALESGAPPHGGFAIGLDRYIAMLLNANSIRDVIAFPKTAGGKDLTTKAPASVTEDVLKRYHIRTIENFKDMSNNRSAAAAAENANLHVTRDTLKEILG